MSRSRFLLSAMPHNAHLQNVARALLEADALGAYLTSGAYDPESRFARWSQRAARRYAPRLGAALDRRIIPSIPPALVETDWSWEIPRLVAGRLGRERLKDWCWERAELSLARRAATLVTKPGLDALFGVEFGALEAIRAAVRAGKPSVVGFLSPHHSMRERWVDSQYEAFPELRTPTTRRLLELARARDARRDEEAFAATAVHASSLVTATSLVSGGIDPAKIAIAPLGCPAAVDEASLPLELPRPARFIYAGTVSALKGAHILFSAWRQIAPRRSAELHVFGSTLLPTHALPGGDRSIVFHGRVDKAAMERAYDGAYALIFPSLCDGFGMVVAEALARGVPVITTTNAGASEMIDSGRNGFVVGPGNSRALAEAIEWCIEHPGAMADMRRAALASARRWTWAHFRGQLRANLDGLLGTSLSAPASPASGLAPRTAANQIAGLEPTAAGS